jgi:hypothetical protein
LLTINQYWPTVCIAYRTGVVTLQEPVCNASGVKEMVTWQRANQALVLEALQANDAAESGKKERLRYQPKVLELGRGR